MILNSAYERKAERSGMETFLNAHYGIDLIWGKAAEENNKILRTKYSVESR